MSLWTDEVEANNGEPCGNCGTFRVLREGYVEECTNCGDDGYDIYGVESVSNLLLP